MLYSHLSSPLRRLEVPSNFKVRYSAFTIRNLNPYESKVFYEFLPKNRFVNPNWRGSGFLNMYKFEIPYRLTESRVIPSGGVISR